MDDKATPTGGEAGIADGYLSEIAEALVAPAATRAEIVSEIGDGLWEAIASYRDRGLTEKEAASAAIAEFGQPDVIAAAFKPELCARQARRSALALMTSGPLVGLAWLFGVLVASAPPARHHLSGPWWALPLVGLAILVGVPGLIFAIVATGRVGLRLAFPSRFSARAVSVASLAAMAADSIMLTIAALYFLVPADSPVLPLVPAIMASLARMFLATRAFRGCRRAALA